MKVYNSHDIKNIALLGNDRSGKTTLTECMLYHAGALPRRGRITQKNTVSDYFPVEQEYGYSVFATAFHVEWNEKKLNIIDCPGSDDFVGAAMTALNVTDTAILLINGAFGPEVGTQNHFRYTENSTSPLSSSSINLTTRTATTTPFSMTSKRFMAKKQCPCNILLPLVLVSIVSST